MQAHIRAGEWALALAVGDEITALEPSHRGTARLVAQAEQGLAEETERRERERKIAVLHREGTDLLEKGRWEAAIARFQQVLALDETHGDAAAKLAQARGGLAREEEAREKQARERERQEKLTSLYQGARGAMAAEEWQQALDTLEQLQARDPDYRDVQKLMGRAQREVQKLEERRQRQEKLETLYAEAAAHLRAERLRAALDKMGEIRSIDRRYPDPERVAATAKRQLAAAGGEAVAPRLPVPLNWQIIVSGLAAVLLIGLAIVVGSVIRSPASTPTETPVVVPTDTATSVPVVVAPSPSPTTTPVPPTATQTSTPRPPTPTKVPSTATATPTKVRLTPTASPTKVRRTATASPTATLRPTSTRTSTPTLTRMPTATPTPTARLSDTPTRTPTPTSTPEPVCVVTASALNLRAGPGTIYDRVGRLGAGDELAIVARNNAGDWVEIETDAGLVGWVFGDLVDCSIPISSIPVETDIPPTPTFTPVPTPTLTPTPVATATPTPQTAAPPPTATKPPPPPP